MAEFDIFTNEIKFTTADFNNVLYKFAKEMSTTPNSANYQCYRKLKAEECLTEDDNNLATFHLSEAVSASLRMLAVYRDEQINAQNGNKLHCVTNYIKPIQELTTNKLTPDEEALLRPFIEHLNIKENIFDKYKTTYEEPLHKKYLQFSVDNNIDNFHSILKELPKEWTVIQLTAPYNPNENLKPFEVCRTEIPLVYLSVFCSDYWSDDSVGPFTIQIPANSTKQGESPLFVELYALLEENYKTIDNAQSLNNKRLLRNYWDRREDIDLRMKSAINVMDKKWLGGWKSLLTGKLMDSTFRDKIKTLVDNTIEDWGFILLTNKQKFLLCHLIETSHWLSISEIKLTIRKILVEHGNPEQMREALKARDCPVCISDYKCLHEFCLQCLAKGFEIIHKFSLADGIKAFSDSAMQVKEYDCWSELQMAKRYPVILIVDEMLDTFPWESLPVLNIHPVTRMENIHFLYYLYKIHEADMEDGYFMAKSDCGRYVINPEKNLDRMEKRMTSFIQYWCPSWIGDISKPPEPDDFLDYLKLGDLFLYCGHGSGCQFPCGSGGRGAAVESARGGRAAALLSGCGSVRLTQAGGTAPPTGAHHHYHIANSPMVVGMLWEVTDLEVDKVVSALMAQYIPSDAPVSWQNVGKAQWSQGVLDLNVEQKGSISTEQDLLRAVAVARKSTKYIMISSSVVARGIPIKNVQEKPFI